MRIHGRSNPLNARKAGLWCIALMLAGSQALAVDHGQVAPEITVTDAHGQPLPLASLRGKLVYVDFWASWCGPCRQSFPWMNAMHDKYAANGLAIVGINVDQKRSDADRFLAQMPARFSVVYDPQGTSPRAYAIKGMPSSVLIDPQGRVLLVHAGFRDDDRAMLEAKIREALPQRAK
jgi:cytochrome c biogenesis protein CcmG/thiol:disulfide interchange protein DsbE